MGTKIPTLLTVTQFSDKHKFITVQGLRWLIYKSEKGDDFDQCILRRPGRVYIDEEKFFEYLKKVDEKCRL